MRVLTVIGDLGPGGTQRVAQNYTVGYKQAGCEAAVLAITAGGPRVENLSQASIPVFIGGKLLEEQSKALQSAIAWRPDIIHIHRRGFSESLTGHVLRELKNLKTRVLETNVFSRVDYSPDAKLIDVHLQLSSWCLWKWNQWARGLNPAPIGAVVPYMIDSSAFYPVSSEIQVAFRNAYGIPDDAFVFGRIGQPLLPKWSPIIFEAFTEVAQRYLNAYLLLVGLPNELRPALISLPKNVRRRIIEIPFIHGDENLRACYSAIDAFLHASQIGESFGMVLVEAMLCGCPVITLSTPTKDNSQLEVVGHERGGLVVTNQKSMIEAMVRLIQDEQLRQHLSQEGAKWVKSQYDISQAMPTLLKIAEIAIASGTQDKLRITLRSEPNIATKVKWSQIRKLLINTIGETSLQERILMHTIHNPWIYRLYSHRLR